MDKLAQDMSTLRDDLEPNWDEQRAARLYQGVGRLRRRRAVQRAVLGTTSLAAVCLLAVKLALPGGAPTDKPTQLAKAPVAAEQSRAAQVDPVVVAQAGHTLRLVDGSVASLIGAHSELSILENTANRVDLKLLTGRAQFDVVKNPARDFVVEAGAYHVTVVGTVFAVEHFEQRVEVTVVEGTVRVEGPTGLRVLTTGEHASFGAGAETALLGQPELSAPESESKLVRKKARTGEKPSWRSLSKDGDYSAAYALIAQGTAVDDDPAALMDAADAARLSGHPAGAVKYLQRVLGQHRSSPVAPLAAFTLGRVYLDHLGQPQSAAESFALARKLAPGGSLAQDALAREVESLSKGGDEREANVKAKQYLRSYPNGRRLRAVQLYGGIE
jgi:transmembrane sensor